MTQLTFQEIDLNQNYWFIDTETTGLKAEDGHRVIELAAVEYKAQIQTGKRMHYYFDVDKQSDPKALEVHGLSIEVIKQKSNCTHFKSVVTELENSLKNSSIVIHNAKFDVSFLNSELQLCNANTKIDDMVHKVIDSLELARSTGKFYRNNLDALARHYSIVGFDRTKHSALVDVELLAQVFFRMVEEQQQNNTARDKLVNNFRDKKYQTPKLDLQSANNQSSIDTLVNLFKKK